MTESRFDPEDEAFNEIERQAKQRKESVKAAVEKPQRPWVGLTDAEIGEIYRIGWANNMELARAIEAKLKEKNT